MRSVVPLRLAWVFMALSACVHGTREPFEAPPAVADATLGVGDMFEVRVFGEADLTGTYRVGAEGTITFPLAGVIKVEGLEPQDAAKKIAERLADGILRNPQVTVLVKEQTSKKVVVMGQVPKPGTYAYTPSMTILEAITAAGGFTQISAKNDTTITRTDKGTKSTTKIPVGDISEGKAKNVYVRAGDIIFVPERVF
jgi:protein involved in polysaccharide export with SLBB domain